ncbi:MAG: hypothetical protein V8T82_05600 [Romboutsia timonensis]
MEYIQVYGLYKISDLGYSCDLISAFDESIFMEESCEIYTVYFSNRSCINKYKARKDLKWRKILKF